MIFLRTLSRAATVAALFATLGSTAIGLTADKAAAASVTIVDALTNGTTRATRRSGGTFTAEGWKVTDNGAGGAIGPYLMYALPANTKSGTVEFEAKGFVFRKQPDGSPKDNREHIWGVFDMDKPHDLEASGSSGYLLRLYDHKQPDGTFYAGAHRFRFISPRTEDIDADKKSAVSWDRNKWYKFRFEWTQTSGRWLKDGALQSSLSGLPNQNKSYRYVYVGSDYRKTGMVPINVTYRNVRITGNTSGN